MRAMIWVGAAALGVLAGGAAAPLFPAARISEAARAVSEDFPGFTIADLNPVRAAYDTVKAKIETPMTPEQMGFQTSPPLNVTMPDWRNLPGVGLTLNPGPQSRWTTSAVGSYSAFARPH